MVSNLILIFKVKLSERTATDTVFQEIVLWFVHDFHSMLCIFTDCRGIWCSHEKVCKLKGGCKIIIKMHKKIWYYHQQHRCNKLTWGTAVGTHWSIPHSVTMEFVRERAKKFSDLKSRNYTEFLRGKPILNGPLERLANFSSFFFVVNATIFLFVTFYRNIVSQILFPFSRGFVFSPSSEFL